MFLKNKFRSSLLLRAVFKLFVLFCNNYMEPPLYNLTFITFTQFIFDIFDYFNVFKFILIILLVLPFNI